MGLVTRKIPPATPAQVKHALSLAAAACARLGLTGVHDAGASEEDLAAYRELIAEGKLTVRVYAMLRNSPELLAKYLARKPELGDRLTVRSIKLVADGALGSRGAALIEPYSDEPSNRGLVIMDKPAIEAIARKAVAAGFQVNTHAIGDRANRNVLDAYQAAFGGRKDLRFRVEHAQIVAPADLKRFADLGLIASMQATHATSDMRWAHLRLGEDRLRGAYAWQTFLKLGVRVANGSDFPVESADPLWGFYSSVTRQDHAGTPAGGWRPQELMSRGQALRSWTLDAAYAAFEENQKGSIETGKLADFVVLSKDIMTVPAKQILEAKVTMTVLGGKVVYGE
jgi:predicted amidohydrolase YtcJ